MLQTPLSLPLPATTDGDRTAFTIGWDHARHGLVPPPALLAGEVGQGWRAGHAVFGTRTLPVRRAVRAWLALRLQAWQAGQGYDLEQLTPAHLASIETPRCAVRRVPLGGAADSADAAVFVRLNEAAAWAAGHVVMLSRAAARAMAGVDAGEARHRAHEARHAGDAVGGLDAEAWARVAALRAMATPMPFAEALRLPLAVLPPNRVRVINPAQGLQALLTLLFATPGWAARAAALARTLPEHTLRTDFNLFVGAMAPRVLEAAAARPGPGVDAEALGQAWLNERVQRRWEHLALALGEDGVQALQDRLAAWPQPQRRVLRHSLPEAMAAWRLPVVAAPPAPARQAGIGAVRRGGPTGRRPARAPGRGTMARLPDSGSGPGATTAPCA